MSWTLVSAISFGSFFLAVLLFLVSIFLIMIILVQEGRGGGITGCAGWHGWPKCFRCQGGGRFHWITVITAVIWITLSLLTISVITRPMRPCAAGNSRNRALQVRMNRSPRQSPRRVPAKQRRSDLPNGLNLDPNSSGLPMVTPNPTESVPATDPNETEPDPTVPDLTAPESTDPAGGEQPAGGEPGGAEPAGGGGNTEPQPATGNTDEPDGAAGEQPSGGGQ